MNTGILIVNLILNSLIVNGQDACIVNVNTGQEWIVNQPTINNCSDIAKTVMEMAKRDYPGAAITLTINGVNLNEI